MQFPVYNQEGKEVGKVELPAGIFGLPWNANLVHQVVTSMMTHKRVTVAHAKDRGEVRGGGKKPWKQKGTGRARHGSIRSPIWIGGGVTHGPTNERNFSRKVNIKMKKKALQTILAQKMREGEILFLDSLTIKEPKTKLASIVLRNLSTVKGFEKLQYKKGNRGLIALPVREEHTSRSFRNIPTVKVTEVKNLNALTALSYQYIVIPRPEDSLLKL